jgi:peroxiredoxin
MNRLKSIFISTFMMVEITFLVLNVRSIVASASLQTGLSVAIPVLILMVFAKFFIFKTPITSVNFPLVSTVLGLIFVGYLALSLLSQQIDTNILIYNTIGLVGWVVYLKWYSVFPDRDGSLLKLDSQIPSISFLNTKGELVSTDEFKGSKVLYMFYRGNWCPLCMAQIKEIANQYQELDKRGVKIVLISPQPQRHTKNLAKKFDVPFIFLTDKDHQAAKQLKIFQEAGTPLGMEVFGYESDTVMPTIIITDEQGKIIFADLTDNYRVRPEPGTFLKVLDGMKKV